MTQSIRPVHRSPRRSARGYLSKNYDDNLCFQGSGGVVLGRIGGGALLKCIGTLDGGARLNTRVKLFRSFAVQNPIAGDLPPFCITERITWSLPGEAVRPQIFLQLQ